MFTDRRTTDEVIRKAHFVSQLRRANNRALSAKHDDQDTKTRKGRENFF